MSVLSNRLHAISVITRRELRANYYSLGLYVAISLAFAVAIVTVSSYLSSVEQNGLMSVKSPLSEPLRYAVFLGAAYLALCSAISITRERDQGTLEVLFYGPVDSVSYVLAKFLEQMITFAVVIAVYLVFFGIVSWLTNLGLGWTFLAQAVLSVLLGSSIIGFGILLSSITKKARTSIILFLSLLALFVVVNLAAGILSGIELSQYTASPVIFARSILSHVRTAISWISPFDYLERGVTAIMIGNAAGFIRRMLEALLYTAVLLAASVYFFNRKGVRR